MTEAAGWNYEMLRFGLALLNVLGTCAIGAYAWFIAHDDKRLSHIEKVENDMNQKFIDVSNRLNIIETTMKHLPTAEQLGVVNNAVAEIRATQTAHHEAMQREAHRQSLSLQRIESYLMKQGG